jgi:hypothetical protein
MHRVKKPGINGQGCISLGLEAGLMQTLDTVGKLERPELAGTCTKIETWMSGLERPLRSCSIVSRFALWSLARLHCGICDA